jgi:two-component system, sensor histidine kinase LadS
MPTLSVLRRLLPVLLLLPVALSAAPVLLTADRPVVLLGPELEYLEDRRGELDIEALRAGQQRGDWARSGQNILSFGYTSSVYWVRFRLVQQEREAISHLVEIAHPVLDRIDAYIYRNGALIDRYSMGDRLPYRARPVDHPNYIFPVRTFPTDVTEVYLRVESTSSVQIPVGIFRGNSLLEAKHNEALTSALFYGAMIIMFMYNLLLFLATRDISFFYYVMYVASILFLLAGIQGLTYRFIWPDNPWMNDPALVVALSGLIFFPSLFFRSFLALQKTRPTLSRILYVFAVLSILTAIAGFFLPYRLMIVSNILLVICAILVGFWSGVVRLLDGYHAARYFLIAWSFMLAAGLLLAINKFGVLPRNWFTENVGQIGACMELMLLSFALANRINYERRLREYAQQESSAAQRKFLAHQIRANEQLDRTVRERTAELEKANARLKEMSSTDALTGLLNRRAFDEISEAEYRRAIREQSSVAVLMIDLDHFKRINDQCGHHFGDLCLASAARVMQARLRRPPDIAARYGGEEFVVFLPGTDCGGAVRVAESLLAALAETVISEGDVSLTVSASIGVASHIPDVSKSLHELMKQADENLYAAKANGRNRVEWQSGAAGRGDDRIPVRVSHDEH